MQLAGWGSGTLHPAPWSEARTTRTNRRGRWAFLCADAGRKTLVPTLPAATLPDPTAMQQPAPAVTDAEVRSSTSNAMIGLQLLDGDHPSAFAAIQAAGCTQIESLVGPEA